LQISKTLKALLNPRKLLRLAYLCPNMPSRICAMISSMLFMNLGWKLLMDVINPAALCYNNFALVVYNPITSFLPYLSNLSNFTSLNDLSISLHGHKVMPPEIDDRNFLILNGCQCLFVIIFEFLTYLRFRFSTYRLYNKIQKWSIPSSLGVFQTLVLKHASRTNG
jgi:hypothetical protein